MDPRSNHGIAIIDKPSGLTSFDVVRRVRKALGTREVGHAGTLDPTATGVLICAIGEATKLVFYLTGARKHYRATIALGVETDTLDAAGREVGCADVPADVRAAIAAIHATPMHPVLTRALVAERARTVQVPPVYSAIQQGGERAHARARRGEDVVMEPRVVQVHDLRIVNGGLEPAPWVEVEMDVSKGYYVRSLARDIARQLGTLGHVSALRRTRSGGFTIEEATALETWEHEHTVIPLVQAARRALPTLILSAAAALHARHGRPVPAEDLAHAAQGPHAWMTQDGALVAIGEVSEDGIGRVLRGFR